MLPGIWSFNCNRKPDWTISKFKVKYCVRGDVQKRLSPKPLNLYSTVVQWATVRLAFIFQCILGLQSQIIDFKMPFLRQIFQVGIQSSLDLPGISGVMEDKVKFLSDQIKSCMVNPKPPDYGMKSYEMVC